MKMDIVDLFGVEAPKVKSMARDLSLLENQF
jgi:hypothetical protein